MPLDVNHTLLRELKLRLMIYDHRVRERSGPVSAEPVLEIARQVAEDYARVRTERNAYWSERLRRLRDERKAKGLCRACGKVGHRPERTTCAACGAKEVEANRRNDPRRKAKREG